MSSPHQVHLKSCISSFFFSLLPSFMSLRKIQRNWKENPPRRQNFLALDLDKEGTERLQWSHQYWSPYSSFFLGLPVVSAEQSFQSRVLCFFFLFWDKWCFLQELLLCSKNECLCMPVMRGCSPEQCSVRFNSWRSPQKFQINKITWRGWRVVGNFRLKGNPSVIFFLVKYWIFFWSKLAHPNLSCVNLECHMETWL